MKYSVVILLYCGTFPNWLLQCTDTRCCTELTEKSHGPQHLCRQQRRPRPQNTPWKCGVFWGPSASTCNGEDCLVRSCSVFFFCFTSSLLSQNLPYFVTWHVCTLDFHYRHAFSMTKLISLLDRYLDLGKKSVLNQEWQKSSACHNKTLHISWSILHYVPGSSAIWIIAFNNQENAYYSSRFGYQSWCHAISGFGCHFVVAGTLGLDLTQ